MGDPFATANPTELPICQRQLHVLHDLGVREGFSFFAFWYYNHFVMGDPFAPANPTELHRLHDLASVSQARAIETPPLPLHVFLAALAILV